MRLWLALLLAFVPAPALAQHTPPAIETVVPQIDALFAAYYAETPVPGLVYGVVRDGRLVHVRGFGVQDVRARRPVTPASLFRIASMTKAFTALAILSLRDEGRLSLDDPAEKHVPEMRGWRYPTADSPRIRIRDLLTHSAGLVTDDPWGDRQTPLPEADFTRMLAAGVPFSRVPQTAHEYSNFGYAVLGRIVANASGMTYRGYVEQRLLRPLGMAASGFQVADAPRDRRAIGYRQEDNAWIEEPTMAHGAFGAMGGLQVSAEDYGRWLGFLLSAWPPRDGGDAGPVRRATVREIQQGANFVLARRRPGSSGAGACMLAQAYGMGWRVAQDCALGLTLSHGGGYPGYGSHVLMLPEHGVAIFVLTNRTYAPDNAAPVWDAAMLMLERGLLPGRATPASPAIKRLHAAARAAYAAGDLGPLEGALAMNVLMDRSADRWRGEFARLKAAVGECPTAAPLAPTGALSTAFRWTCARGAIDGTLLLAPTSPPTIQSLRMTEQPAARP